MAKQKQVKRELVVLEDGKEVARVNLNQGLYVVLNDSETFSPINGSSIWQDKTKKTLDLTMSDYERTFNGYQETKGLKKLINL